MYRWIAKLLVLVMIVPAFAPAAMAWPAQREAPHCLRQPAKTVMQCHHGMAMASDPVSAEASFRAVDQCCQNHDCCRGMAAPQWAQPQARPVSHFNLPVYPAPVAQRSMVAAPGFSGLDSARAPPRN